MLLPTGLFTASTKQALSYLYIYKDKKTHQKYFFACVFYDILNEVNSLGREHNEKNSY